MKCESLLKILQYLYTYQSVVRNDAVSKISFNNHCFFLFLLFGVGAF